MIQPELLATNASVLHIERGEIHYTSDGIGGVIQINHWKQLRDTPTMPMWRVDIWEDDGIRFIPHLPVESTQLEELTVVSVGDLEAVVRHLRSGFISSPEPIPVPLPSVVRQLCGHVGQRVVAVTPSQYSFAEVPLLRLANSYELAIFARGGNR